MWLQEQSRQFRQELSDELKNNILPYWSQKMLDKKNGGYYGRRDGYDILHEQADKSVILNTRILWTFSHAAARSSISYLPFADIAYNYLVDHFVDEKMGGVYWMVDYKGIPTQTKKQIYAQAFAMYAIAEYFQVTQRKECLDLAISLFHLIEKYSFDPVYNGYLEAFDKNWNLLEDLRLSEKDANEKKTMNTHLHVLEAYTNLYRCFPDRKLAVKLENLISIFRDHIISKEYHFNLFFDEQWRIRSHEISFGHDIEGSWLLVEAAEVLGNKKLLKEVQQLSLNILEVTARQGLDIDGGVMNEASDRDKHWWPQAEAMVGFINGWQLTEDPEYFEKAIQIWEFIKARLIDKKNGEWFWRVDKDGNVNHEEDKAGPWKCPYHNGRAVLELLKRLPE